MNVSTNIKYASVVVAFVVLIMILSKSTQKSSMGNIRTSLQQSHQLALTSSIRDEALFHTGYALGGLDVIGRHPGLDVEQMRHNLRHQHNRILGHAAPR